MRRLILFLVFCFSISGISQELNCKVVVNAQQTGDENLQQFKTLEKQLNEFVNKTKWTSRIFKNQERIDCSFIINISEYSGDIYNATLQVLSSRPVFGSSYTSPVYNYNDKNFRFQYLEFQNIIFNPEQFESNLASTLAFHIYMVLGLDADSFKENGGEAYFKQAQKIVNYSQQENFKGWSPSDGLQSRYALIDNVLSPTYKEFRSVMYAYHRNGLDQMSDNPQKAKKAIISTLSELKAIHGRRPNSYLMRVFFDGKADEISDMFSSGPRVDISEFKSLLNKIAPIHATKWRNIKL